MIAVVACTHLPGLGEVWGDFLPGEEVREFRFPAAVPMTFNFRSFEKVIVVTEAHLVPGGSRWCPHHHARVSAHSAFDHVSEIGRQITLQSPGSSVIAGVADVDTGGFVPVLLGPVQLPTRPYKLRRETPSIEWVRHIFDRADIPVWMREFVACVWNDSPTVRMPFVTEPELLVLNMTTRPVHTIVPYPNRHNSPVLSIGPDASWLDRQLAALVLRQRVQVIVISPNNSACETVTRVQESIEPYATDVQFQWIEAENG